MMKLKPSQRQNDTITHTHTFTYVKPGPVAETTALGNFLCSRNTQSQFPVWFVGEVGGIWTTFVPQFWKKENTKKHNMLLHRTSTTDFKSSSDGREERAEKGFAERLPSVQLPNITGVLNKSLTLDGYFKSGLSNGRQGDVIENHF